MIDLHVHSYYSDGTFSPAQIVEEASNLGIKVLSLTDHDTTRGLEEAKKTCDRCGIKFINGIEINIEREFGEFHLLGYGINPTSKPMQELVDNCVKMREDRNERICEMMCGAGFPIDYSEFKKTQSGVIGRPNFARYLVEHKYVKTVQQAFDKYFAVGRPLYLKTDGTELSVAIQAIKESGGVPIIAHPLSLYLSWGKLAEELASIKKCGVMWLEAWNGGTKPTHCERLERLAKDLAMIVTAGSDYHGENKHNKLGYKTNGEAIDDRFYTENLATVLLC